LKVESFVRIGIGSVFIETLLSTLLIATIFLVGAYPVILTVVEKKASGITGDNAHANGLWSDHFVCRLFSNCCASAFAMCVLALYV
jgi:hypothetical protein